MSAPEVTEKLVAAINEDRADFYIVNFANCDMVGHTGVFDAAVKAVEAVDDALSKVVPAILAKGGFALITADHGNADHMFVVASDGSKHPFTAHTTNRVPFIIVATLFQLHLASKLGPVACLIFAYVLTGWIGTASRVRTQFYRFKNSEYVMAARTLGAKDRRLIWKHIFPNSLGTIVTSAALSIPSVINSESMLSYLGIVKLGTASTTSLGNLLAEAQGIWTNYPHLMICPALVLSLLMICFNLFGNGLRDAFNPSLRGVDE